MAVTSEAIKEAKRLLQSGRKKEATSSLKEPLKFTSRECGRVVRILEDEIRLQDKMYGPSYKKPDLDNPLMVSTLTSLWGKGDRMKAIELVKRNHVILLEDCVSFLETTRKNYTPVPSLKRESVFRSRNLLWIPFILGAAFLGFATYKVVKQEQMIATSARLSAKVVDMHFQYRGGNAPIVAFPWEGGERRHQSPIHSRNTPYFIGEDVFVFVNRENPEEVIIDTFTDRWATPAVFALVGGGAWIAAIAVLLYWRRR